MTNLNTHFCAFVILAGCSASSASANDLDYYGYARPAVAPVTTVRVTPYAGVQGHTVHVAPHRGVTPVRTAPAQGYDNVRRAPGIVRTARFSRPVAPQRITSLDDREPVRPSPFEGRQAILDSRLATGSVIR